MQMPTAVEHSGNHPVVASTRATDVLEHFPFGRRRVPVTIRHDPASDGAASQTAVAQVHDDASNVRKWIILSSDD
jgi:hypothetical protein